MDMDRQLIRATLSKIKKHVRYGDNLGQQNLRVTDDRTDECDEVDAVYNLRMAWDLMITLLERLEFRFLYRRAAKEFTSFDKHPLASAMGPEERYLVWPWKIQNYVRVVEVMTLTDDEPEKPESIRKLLEILEGCEKHIQDRKVFSWLPTCEEDVHNRIQGLLECYYSDTTGKPPIAKPIKNFEPDTGIPSIRTLIEYKYVSSDSDAKRVVDEILADIGGYQGKDYRTFIFVIYETQRFRRLTDWKEVVRQSKPPNPIEVVLLKGIKPSNEDETLSH